MTYNVNSTVLIETGNVTDVFTFVSNVNSNLMNNMFGILLLIGLGGVLLIGFIRTTNDPKKSFAAASLILVSFSILLRALNLVPDIAMFATIAMVAVSIVLLFIKLGD